MRAHKHYDSFRLPQSDLPNLRITRKRSTAPRYDQRDVVCLSSSTEISVVVLHHARLPIRDANLFRHLCEGLPAMGMAGLACGVKPDRRARGREVSGGTTSDARL